MLLLVLSSVASGGGTTRFQLDLAEAQRIAAGREQIERLQLDPAGRSCWAGAVDDLKEGCRSMDDVQRSRLAVRVSARGALARRAFFPCPLTLAPSLARRAVH